MSDGGGLLPWLVPAAALLSALLVRAMIAARILDRPNARSSHAAPTPRGGGVGVVGALVAGLAAPHLLGPAPLLDARALALLGGTLLVAALGLADDLRTLRFREKLAVQTLAAALAMAGGLVFHHVPLPGAGTVALGPLAWPLTWLWLVGLTNAMNFIDGLNGLCAGTSLIASLFLAACAPPGEPLVPAAALLLAAGCAGFLPFNFPRAAIFLGDVGSQALGFALAALGVVVAGAPAAAGPGAGFWLVPVLLFAFGFDTLFTLARRARAGEAVTEAHRGHLYQVAQRAGMAATRVTLLHWGFAVLQGLAALPLARLAWRGGADPGWAALSTLSALAAIQLVWLAAVLRRARLAGLSRW